MGQYQTFIIRFWTDETEEAARGHIQHVASGRGLYFRDIARMLSFLGENLSSSTVLECHTGAGTVEDAETIQDPDSDDVRDGQRPRVDRPNPTGSPAGRLDRLDREGEWRTDDRDGSPA